MHRGVECNYPPLESGLALVGWPAGWGRSDVLELLRLRHEKPCSSRLVPKDLWWAELMPTWGARGAWGACTGIPELPNNQSNYPISPRWGAMWRDSMLGRDWETNQERHSPSRIRSGFSSYSLWDKCISASWMLCEGVSIFWSEHTSNWYIQALISEGEDVWS